MKFENINKKTIDLVEVREPYEVFSMSGNIWNNRKTDIICGGQCCEDFIEFFPNNKPLKRLIEIWNEWHLNDLNAGTRKQKEALKNFKGDYIKQCEFLESKNLLIDNAYIYGTAWLLNPLPIEIKNEIIELTELLNS